MASHCDLCILSRKITHMRLPVVFGRHLLNTSLDQAWDSCRSVEEPSQQKTVFFKGSRQVMEGS